MLENDPTPALVTPAGIVIKVTLEQPCKKYAGKCFTLSPIITDFKVIISLNGGEG